MTAAVRRRARRLVALSDIHADGEALRVALVGSGLCEETAVGLVWSAAPGTVLVVVGDFIDGPTGAIGVWRVAAGLRRLEIAAAAAGSEVVVLLGNHETDLLGGAWSLCGGRPQLAASLGLSADGSPSQHPLGAWLATRPLVAIIGGCVLVHGGPTHAWENWAQPFESFQAALESLCAQHGLGHPLVGNGPESILAAAAPRALPAFATDGSLRQRFVAGWGGSGLLLVGHHAGIPGTPDLVPLDGGLRHGSRRVRVADVDLVSGRVSVVDLPLERAA